MTFLAEEEEEAEYKTYIKDTYTKKKELVEGNVSSILNH